MKIWNGNPVYLRRKWEKVKDLFDIVSQTGRHVEALCLLVICNGIECPLLHLKSKCCQQIVFLSFSHQVFVHAFPSNHYAAAVLQLKESIWCNNCWVILLLPAKAIPDRVGFHPWQCCLEQTTHPVDLHHNAINSQFCQPKF